MNKFTKLLGILFLCGSLFFITACSKNSIDNIKPNRDPDINDKYEEDEQYQIYELAIREGKFNGTYEQWLASIKGENGKPGENGKSAYELYKQLHPEYEGSLQQWLESLKGKDGVNGQDGVDGKSAYELYKEAYPEYTGTLEEWLESLKGQDGQDGKDGVDGKSAYELYLESHPEYNKTEVEWLDDLINDKLGKKELHTIIFDSNGGTNVENQKVDSMSKIKKPKVPVKKGYIFDGWYVGDEKWSFNGNIVTEDITLKAKWIIKSNDFAFDIDNYGNISILRYIGSEKNVVIPETYYGHIINVIEADSFMRSDIETLVMPDTIKIIGTSAFAECKNLKSITLSKGLLEMNNNIFWGCTNLTGIEIPENVNSIGECLTYKTPKLTSIKVNEENKYYDSRNNCNAIIDKKTNALIAGCKTTIIPEDVISIGSHAFAYCPFKTINIPASVKVIGNQAFFCSDLEEIDLSKGVEEILSSFKYCGNLRSVTFGNKLKAIRMWSFLNCFSLTHIELPNSLEYLADEAFANSGLKSIIIPIGVKKISCCCFYNCKDLIIYCEQESKPDQWCDNWYMDSIAIYWKNEWSYNANNEPIPNI